MSAENRTGDGTVFVAENTELLAKLQRPAVSSPFDRTPATDDDTTGAPAEFPSDEDAANGCESGVWSRGIRATVIHADWISVSKGDFFFLYQLLWKLTTKIEKRRPRLDPKLFREMRYARYRERKCPVENVSRSVTDHAVRS